MKKILLLNGSPRKNWNTHKLLMEAERGAQEMGAETKLVHLFDLKNATDCKSCFACKIKGSKTNGICALRDDMRPVLEYAWEADGIILGSPVYYSNMTAPALAFKNRLLFPVMNYDIDPVTGKYFTNLKEPKRCGLILSGNFSAEYAEAGYGSRFESERYAFEFVFGSAEMQLVPETYQFSDYSKYHANSFDEKARAERREKYFPIDLQNAYEMGRRIAE